MIQCGHAAKSLDNKVDISEKVSTI